MHEVLVNRLGGLSLPRKSVVRLTDRPDMTSTVYFGRKTTQLNNQTQLGQLYVNIFICCTASKIIKKMVRSCQVKTC